MKKAISLLLVLAVALSMSVVAFAAEDIPGTFGGKTKLLPAATRIALASPGSTDVYDIEAGELFLVDSNKIVGTETELRPDETYKFDIYYATAAINDRATADILLAGNNLSHRLTKADMGTGTVKVRTITGSSAIQSAKIKTVGTGAAQTFRLDIETRPNYGTKTSDVEYSLNAIDVTTTKTFKESNHTFTVGFNEISDSDTDVGEEGTITITNDSPVITKDQFTDIAKSANYKNVIFEADDGNWTFKGKVAGMKDTNFSYNYDPDTDLLNKFPDQEFKFLNFPAGVNFPTTGEMKIDVSDVSEDFKTMYAYLYRDGKLTEINSTYDSGADELVFRTNYLGKFIVTNEPITDTSMIPEPDEEEEEEIVVPEVPGDNTNPSTGAASSNVVALGIMTLAAATFVSRKRK